MLKHHRPIAYTYSTVGTALMHYRGASGEADTVRTIIKKLFPVAAAMPAAEFAVFLNGLPVADLEPKLAASGTGWSAETKADLVVRHPGDKTLMERYPGILKRFVTFTAAAGMRTADDGEFLPEWESFVELAFGQLPAGKAMLKKLVAAGAKTYLGDYPIDVDNLDATANKISNMRCALRRLARACSRDGLTPRDFAEQVLGADDDAIDGYIDKTIYRSYGRNLWNAAVVAHPDLDLPIWEDRSNGIGRPREAWAEPLRAGVDSAFFDRGKRKELAEDSKTTYTTQFAGAFGILEIEGLHLAELVEDLEPKDAMRLVFGCWPKSLLTGDAAQDAPLALYLRLKRDPAFKQSVLEALRAAEGEQAGRKLVESPFVTVVVNFRLAKAQYAAADGFLDRVFTINRSYLETPKERLGCLIERYKQLDELREEAETPYDEKKEVVFEHIYLYEDVLARAKQLAESLPERFKPRTMQWANHVRDLVYLVLVTLYPLRVKNHRLMKLGENYDPVKHVIDVKKKHVKNKKRIRFELPESGYNAWVRPLVELYVNEARPMLLGNTESSYFYVGNREVKNARGYIARQRFNEILETLSEKYFMGVLPPALGHLSPHIFRHIAATYQIAVRKDIEMAALLLNDTVETVQKHYADLLRSSRETCKRFHDDFEPKRGT